MRNPVGDFLRRLRMDNNQILKDMANNLGVTSAFLSAVENGKKRIPESWYEKLKRMYALQEDEIEELRNLDMEAQKSISVNINKAPAYNRELAVSFARNFEDISEQTSRQIMALLRKDKKNE